MNLLLCLICSAITGFCLENNVPVAEKGFEMKDYSQTFIWSDGWCLESDKAWFVDGMSNTLFCVKLHSGKCEKVGCIPESKKGAYRRNPYCVKCGKDIFCIPGYGESIWIYNLDDKNFTEINLEGLGECHLGKQAWVWNDKIFIVVANWNKIIEISISQREVTAYHTICGDDNVQKSILVGDKIYAVSSGFGRIYQFDLLTKKVTVHLLPDREKKMFAMCFDGERFWLSGYQNEVYLWDKEKDSFTTISLSNVYEVYNFDKMAEKITDNNVPPVFNRIIYVGGFIWFIPIHSKKILYADKKNAALSVLEIHEEDKISVSLQKMQGIGNFLMEYVRDSRYIGLFSAQNSRVLEVDTEQLTYQWKKYYLTEHYLRQYCEACEGVYYEAKDPLCVQDYHMRKRTESTKVRKTAVYSVGMKIHAKLIKENML